MWDITKKLSLWEWRDNSIANISLNTLKLYLVHSDSLSKLFLEIQQIIKGKSESVLTFMAWKGS